MKWNMQPSDSGVKCEMTIEPSGCSVKCGMSLHLWCGVVMQDVLHHKTANEYPSVNFLCCFPILHQGYLDFDLIDSSFLESNAYFGSWINPWSSMLDHRGITDGQGNDITWCSTIHVTPGKRTADWLQVEFHQTSLFLTSLDHEQLVEHLE